MASNEFQPIVDALAKLESNPFIDSANSIFTAVLSTALGIGATIFTNKYQERINAETHKLRVINRTTLSIAEMRANLIAIKENYYGSLGTDPISRLLSIPPIMTSFSIPTLETAELTFLAQKVDAGNLNKNRWVRAEIIDALFTNYRSLIEQWALQTKEALAVHQILASNGIQFDINGEQLFRLLGVPAVIRLTDLTEKVLRLTDELLLELSCCLIGFPYSAKDMVKKSVKEKYGGVLFYKLPDNDFAKNIISFVPEIDMNAMANIQDLSVEEAKQRYRYLYI